MKDLFRIFIKIPGSQERMNLESRVDETDDADQDHEARGKKVHDEFKGIIEMKGTDQGLNTENKKKNRDN